VPDRAVLAGRVDPLEHDEDAALALRPEAILQVGQPFETGGELLVRGLFRVAVRRGRVDLCQIDPPADGHPKRVP
jgi:hypothetical protein